MYLGDETLDGLGDETLDGVRGCDCDRSGLSGMGISIPTTSSPSGSVPWWQTAINEISKIIPRTPTVPTYPTTFPSYPSVPPYEQTQGSAYNAPLSALPSWLLPALGVGAVLLLTKRGR